MCCLSRKKSIIDNGNPDNHGEKRYLEKVLLKGAGALRKTGADGPVSYFECEANPSKIHDDFPALKVLCERLHKLNPGESFSVGAFLNETRKAPYGSGGTPLMLSLAHIIRAYGERLIVYKDSTMMMEQSIRSYEDLSSIVSDPSSKVVFVVRDISDAQSKLVDLIAKAVGAPSLKHGEARTLGSAFEEVKQWWQKLPYVSKVASLFEKEDRKRLTAVKDLLNGLSGKADTFDVLLEQLPAIYVDGFDKDRLTEVEAESIGQAFGEDVKRFNGAELIARNKVAGALCEIYGGKGDMIECEKLITNWYEGLNPTQRDPHRSDNEDASQFLTRLADQSATYETKLLKLLPDDYGFGAVNNWTALHIEDYVAKVNQAKAEIDKAKPMVQKPAIKEDVYEVGKSEKKTVLVPDGAKYLIYTTDETDPRQSETSHKVTKELDIASLLVNQPNVKVRMRSMDGEGNVSDLVTVEVVSKEHKYDVKVKEDFFGVQEATFKWPVDSEGLNAVVKSLINYGVTMKLISESKAKKLLSAVTEILDGK